MKWMVEFGHVRRFLEEVHPKTGLPDLIAPLKGCIEQALRGDHGGLTVVFQVHPRHGLTYAFRGPEPLVKAARAAMGVTGSSLPPPPAFRLRDSPLEPLIRAPPREAHMDDPKKTQDPKPGGEQKPIVDQVTDVAADAAAELASTAVKALAEGAKTAIRKRTPKKVKKAVAAVTQAAAKTRKKRQRQRKHRSDQRRPLRGRQRNPGRGLAKQARRPRAPKRESGSRPNLEKRSRDARSHGPDDTRRRSNPVTSKTPRQGTEG